VVGEDGVVGLDSLDSALDSFGLTADSVGVAVAVAVELVVVVVILVPNPEEDVDALETVPNPEKEDEAPPNPVDPKTDGFVSVVVEDDVAVLPKAGVAKEKLLPNRGLLAVAVLVVEEEDSAVCLLASKGKWILGHTKGKCGLGLILGGRSCRRRSIVRCMR
jgi:hypothetical protein